MSKLKIDGRMDFVILRECAKNLHYTITGDSYRELIMENKFVTMRFFLKKRSTVVFYKSKVYGFSESNALNQLYMNYIEEYVKKK